MSVVVTLAERQVLEVNDTATVAVAREQIQVVTVGTQGPPGPAGSGGDARYSQPFNLRTSVTVTHNLNKYPSVTCVDSAGTEFLAEVNHVNPNVCLVSWRAPTSGVIYCN